MLTLKNHPFALETFFESSLVLTYAVPKNELQKLIPECLQLDTFNDEWVLNTTDAGCTVAVFDKAGRKVFEQKGSPVKWNGNYSDTPAPQGTYFYVLSCPGGAPVTGHFLLAR